MNDLKELQKELRSKAIDSLYFTATALLGYDKLTTHLHYEMCKTAEATLQSKRLLMLVPRNHYKTTICTIAYPVWRALRNPNETGLIVANTATNAAHFLAKMRSAFESRPLLRSLFPELRPELSKRWNKNEACLPRQIDHPEATWEAAGWDTRVTSRHYDYIIFDDLVDETSYDNPEVMSKLIEAFEQREALLRPPIMQREILVVMNHWSLLDLACHILANHKEYSVYYRQAIENGQPIFPEAYPLEWLLGKQRTDPYTFACQWMNNPIDPGTTEFDKKHLRYYTYKPEERQLVLDSGETLYLGQLNIYGAVDFRHSLSITRAEKITSRNAVVIVGIDSKGRRYLLEEYAERSDPAALLRKVLYLHKKWRPISFGIESYGFQKAFKPLAEELWKREDVKPRLELLPQDTQHSKEARIRAGCKFFEAGLGYIRRDQPLFYEEYITFPAGKTKDGLDAWSWAMTLCRAPLNEEECAADRMRDEEHLQKLHPTTGI